MGVDYAEWFGDGEFIPEFTWCEDCKERIKMRDSVQVLDGADEAGHPETVLVCYECADRRMRV